MSSSDDIQVQVRLRDGTPADVRVVTRFNLMLAQETEDRVLHAQQLRAGVLAALEDPTRGRYVLAERDGQVVGQIMLTTEWSDWRNGWFWWVQSAFVERSHRGQGVFRALFEHAEALAREADGVCGLRLYVERSNRAALRTYDRLGLHDAGYAVLEVDWS